jgi:hypothetical protein
MSVLDSLDQRDWTAVRRHYDNRIRVHNRLLKLHQQRSVAKFVDLALGLTDPAANYSAVEHSLGPRILAENINPEQRIFDLAGEFVTLASARTVPEIIRKAQLGHLRIGVGSELSCMVNPQVCWVANTRTIWTHLVVKHADNIAKADEELKLYRDADVTSEMAYAMWTHIHAELDVALTRIAELAHEHSKRAKVVPGTIKYLWADATASRLYDMHHN